MIGAWWAVYVAHVAWFTSVAYWPACEECRCIMRDLGYRVRP